jgi:hypothetical protein
MNPIARTAINIEPSSLGMGHFPGNCIALSKISAGREFSIGPD